MKTKQENKFHPKKQFLCSEIRFYLTLIVFVILEHRMNFIFFSVAIVVLQVVACMRLWNVHDALHKNHQCQFSYANVSTYINALEHCKLWTLCNHWLNYRMATTVQTNNENIFISFFHYIRIAKMAGKMDFYDEEGKHVHQQQSLTTMRFSLRNCCEYFWIEDHRYLLANKFNPIHSIEKYGNSETKIFFVESLKMEKNWWISNDGSHFVCDSRHLRLWFCELNTLHGHKQIKRADAHIL